MSPEITVALVAAVPALVAAVGAWRSDGLKQVALQVARIEKKLDHHIDYHLQKDQ